MERVRKVPPLINKRAVFKSIYTYVLSPSPSPLLDAYFLGAELIIFECVCVCVCYLRFDFCAVANASAMLVIVVAAVHVSTHMFELCAI